MLSTLNLLDSVESNEPAPYPEGISDKNSSGSAYKAIIAIREQKKKYIQSHSKKTDFRTEKSYLVQRQEVSDLVGVAVQTLFNTSTYSNRLTEEWKGVNTALNEMKENKLSAKSSRTQANSKSEIYKENQALKAEVKALKQQMVTEQITLSIEKMSIKARKLLLP